MNSLQEASRSSKKRERNADVESSSAIPSAIPITSAAPTMAGGGVSTATTNGGLATKNFNFMASTPQSMTPGMTATAIPATTSGGIASRNFNFVASSTTTTPSAAENGNSANNIIPPKQRLRKGAANNKQIQKTTKSSSSKTKEDMLSSLGLLPAASKIRVKSCDPTAGLTLGGVPVTPEKLANLSPMDLDEHVLMRNGEPLPIDELAQLLGMEDDFDDIDEATYGLDGDQQEDELILGMIENGMLDLFLQNMGGDM